MDLEELPISAELRAELDRLAVEYDESLNWDYPPDPGPWREARCLRFNTDVRAALARLRAELGPEREIEDGFDELHEDPDLDRYLADPKGFKRWQKLRHGHACRPVECRYRTNRKNVRTSSTNSSGCS
ncbi:hypothetical protein ACIA5G_21350 [Amycolatopsis sp. NPDC051758]|uniref:hypothetical protein n=1 Tax=Amycolatopsis sp. NPDC051758 TaxID=3363935 RepID=UPI0037AD331E